MKKNRNSAAIAAAQSILIGIAVSVPVAALGIFLSHELLGLMGASETIINEMYTYTMIMMGGNIVIMLLFIVNAVFRGAGDTVTPTWLNFICFWIIEIPLAWLLTMNLGMNENGVFWSIVVAESMFGIIAIWIFSKGKWKEKQV